MADSQAQAFPAKRFFVDMLTRDIELQDAILDLLDNCVDGAMRLNQSRSVDPVYPYKGYEARLTLTATSFVIDDNCGGIPRDLAEKYAFRMGRPDIGRDPELPTVGVYGIGMKRAIFKIGRSASILSRVSKDESFEVKIDPRWMDNDEDWNLPIADVAANATQFGTSIRIGDLRDGVSRLMSDQSGFVDDLHKAIAAYYGYIIEKGFRVYVNNEEVTPVQVAFLFDQRSFTSGEGIAPYVYTNDKDDVSVKLVVGIYRDLPTEQEEEEALAGKAKTERAGWTIICNDRVVMYADKSRLTGWGEAGVPSYHTQFVSIAGVVVLKSNHPAKLPITTTKRGIDGNSELYLNIKEHMREGLKVFTDFTNRWKRPSAEREELRGRAVATSAEAIAALVPQEKWSTVYKAGGGRRFKPNLPMPKETDPIKQIRFSKRMSEIQLVAEFLFDDKNTPIGKVGEQCFDNILGNINK
ncbi:TPA: ATP-binding protein [Burkholderia multivorans]|nr:ATP-binding protein [Burkholderia multivorans]